MNHSKQSTEFCMETDKTIEITPARTISSVVTSKEIQIL